MERAMTATQPPPPPQASSSSSSPTNNNDNNKHRESDSAVRAAEYLRFKYYAAYTFLVASPILIALPPRKLDLYTFSLAGAFAVSGEYLYRERCNGQSIGDVLRERFIKDGGGGPTQDDSSAVTKATTTKNKQSSSFISNAFRNLPSDRAQEVQAKLRAAQEDRVRQGSITGEELERLKHRQQEHKQAEKSIAERIWMGNETEGWKERRLHDEQKALEEGKSYGDLIMDHIRDACTWGDESPSEEPDQVLDLERMTNTNAKNTTSIRPKDRTL